MTSFVYPGQKFALWPLNQITHKCSDLRNIKGVSDKVSDGTVKISDHKNYGFDTNFVIFQPFLYIITSLRPPPREYNGC